MHAELIITKEDWDESIAQGHTPELMMEQFKKELEYDAKVAVAEITVTAKEDLPAAAIVSN